MTVPAKSVPWVGEQPKAVGRSEEEICWYSLPGSWLGMSTVDMEHPDMLTGQFRQRILELLISRDGDHVSIRVPVLQVQTLTSLCSFGEEAGNALLELLVGHLSRVDLELASAFSISDLEEHHLQSSY